MILPEQTLSSEDKVIVKDGHLAVIRPITFYLCRCRECKDACKVLTEAPLCVRCNNGCSQRADPEKYSSKWLGRFTGPRRMEQISN